MFQRVHVKNTIVNNRVNCNFHCLENIHIAMQETPGSRFLGPLRYSWASLVAQLVKNQPAMWEIWVQSLGWEDALERGKVYPLQYSGLENSMDSQRVEHN